MKGSRYLRECFQLSLPTPPRNVGIPQCTSPHIHSFPQFRELSLYAGDTHISNISPDFSPEPWTCRPKCLLVIGGDWRWGQPITLLSHFQVLILEVYLNRSLSLLLPASLRKSYDRLWEQNQYLPRKYENLAEIDDSYPFWENWSGSVL